ncbi:hypothetical protein TVAG_261120 [Trichomonas vaginalis G3]|uniref:Uncharacterized protein n=1 Tax=Trichomonas vaginalis (strain ATCC PRA-98 / G3) TaxID=412133 RepID=A2FPS2_TRIV3|nr:armadillo (ARM) repeat-containing protein family [Trichomonas vaginalis G3]EAX93102.1 hypothetical protein TVAG_261120 [Trichomonas vaginalis G3]KAI5516619.1 armadillo (ARM) repeat-containing protein family [Trichomonas vaginalis G3]|eukprot:XP_001306032.1 hypothetical protein [Trichomonas vaginalis G3]
MKNISDFGSETKGIINHKNALPAELKDVEIHMEALNSSDQDIIIEELKYFNNLVSKSKIQTQKYLLEAGLVEKLFQFFYETTNIAILTYTLHLILLFTNNELINIDLNQFEPFCNRVLGIFTTHELQIYRYLFDILIYFGNKTTGFTDYMLEQFVIDELTETWICEKDELTESMILNAKLIDSLLHTKFKVENIDPFIFKIQSIIATEIPETLKYIISSLIIVQKLGGIIKYGPTQKKFFTKSLMELESAKNLLQLLAQPQSSKLFDDLWNPEFRNILIGACLQIGQDLPEYFGYFLIQIADKWKPLSDDPIISFLILLISNGTFIQRLAASTYIQKLFSYGDLDFIVDLIDMKLMACLVALIQDSNDQLLEISINIATMAVITFQKIGEELSTIPFFDQFMESIEEIDEDDIPVQLGEKIANIKEMVSSKEETDK